MPVERPVPTSEGRSDPHHYALFKVCQESTYQVYINILDDTAVPEMFFHIIRFELVSPRNSMKYLHKIVSSIVVTVADVLKKYCSVCDLDNCHICLRMCITASL